jgi:xylan 1,4-beta-xylosidase
VNLQGAVSWSFEFEDQEWFAGFRDLATNGVDKPVLNVFRMFGMMHGKRVAVKADNGINAAHIIAGGVREKADINAMASKSERSVSVMVWNYHDDDLEDSTSFIALTVDGLGSKNVLVHHYRVDRLFSNSFEKWKAMGKPRNVNAEQYKELERAGQLQLLTSPQWIETKDGKGMLHFELPRPAVSLIRMTW